MGTRVISRQRECPCGYFGVTEERWVTTATGSTRVARLHDTGVLGLITGVSPVETPPLLSDLDPIPSLASLPPAPDLIPQGDQEVDHEAQAAKKGAPLDYAAAFDEFWGAIRSNRGKGLKSLAFQRWKERGKPAADVLITKWDEYMISLGDTFAMDVCRWIAARGWLEAYDAPPPAARRQLARAAGHSPVTAGKDYSAGLDLFKKGAAT